MNPTASGVVLQRERDAPRAGGYWTAPLPGGTMRNAELDGLGAISKWHGILRIPKKNGHHRRSGM